MAATGLRWRSTIAGAHSPRVLAARNAQICSTVSEIPVAELVAMKKKDKSKAQRIEEQQAEYYKHSADPRLRPYRPEEIFEEVKTTSILEDPC